MPFGSTVPEVPSRRPIPLCPPAHKHRPEQRKIVFIHQPYIMMLVQQCIQQRCSRAPHTHHKQGSGTLSSGGDLLCGGLHGGERLGRIFELYKERAAGGLTATDGTNRV